MLRRPFGFYRVRTPWNEMERLRREVNRLFSDAYSTTGARPAAGYPAMNVWTNEDGALITAELPGVSTEDIDISVVGDTLTLTGSRNPVELKEGERYHRQERGYGKFSRSFQLPFQVDANKVEARFEKGVLHISLPRAEADKPKKIAIKAG